MSITKLLDTTIKRNASDLHLLVSYPAMIRIDGILAPIPGEPVLTEEVVRELALSLLTKDQEDLLFANKELDFSYEYGASRFRANIYFQRGALAVALRHLPQQIKTIEELSLPKICHEFARLRQGLILVTGPTGHGKTTTLAAMINEINFTREAHVITIEDPIEYVYSKGKALISQREMHTDTHSWSVALRSALREDPDVVLVGEMRDYETIAAAITIAETGHLVFATLHTNSAAQTIDRVIDVFPENQQTQVRSQLAFILEGVISQRLLPALTGGRLPAVEILIGSPAVQTAIREGKTHLIDNIIQTSVEMGMMLLETSLSSMVRRGIVSINTAKEFALRPKELMRILSSS